MKKKRSASVAKIISEAREAERFIYGDEEIEIGLNGEWVSVWAYSPSREGSRHIKDVVRYRSEDNKELTDALDDEGIAYVL